VITLEMYFKLLSKYKTWLSVGFIHHVYAFNSAITVYKDILLPGIFTKADIFCSVAGSIIYSILLDNTSMN